MRDNILIYSLTILVVVIAGGAVLFLSMDSGGTPDIQIVSITTDQPVYHSRETMVIHIEISSSAYMENLTLAIEGIRDKFEKARLNTTQSVNLQKGSNFFSINFTLPVCSKCAGLPPGEYTMNASILRGTLPIATVTRTVLLE